MRIGTAARIGGTRQVAVDVRQSRVAIARQILEAVQRQLARLLDQCHAPRHQGRPLDFLGRTQQRQSRQDAAERYAAARARQRHREKQTQQRRGNPGEQRWGEKPQDGGGHGAQQHVPIVEVPGIAPSGAAAVAPLRLPARIAAHEDFKDVPALNQHEDRRIQRREDDFQQEACRNADDAAAAAAQAPRRQRMHQTDDLRDQQHDHAEPEQRHHQLDVESRPGRKQLEIVIEIFGSNQVRLHGEREADADHQQPQGRGQIAHDADAEMHAAGEGQARGADDFHVLQIALCPAAVANGDVDQRRRRLFPGTDAVGGHAHLPSGAPHERRLDEVVREHVAAERLAALELGQAAALRKCRDANDGVVAPVIAAVAGPGRQTSRDDRAVDAGGELLQPAEKGVRTDEPRRRLQDPQLRVRVHHLHQSQQRRCVDQAVGVEHDHVVVAPAPARDEFLDIARLAGDVAPAPPIPHGHDGGE